MADVIKKLGHTAADLDKHIDSEELHLKEGEREAIASIGGKASAADLVTHTENTDLHVSAEERASWAETKEQAALNRSAIGFQRKNLLKNTAVSGALNGISYTVGDDGSITVGTGTATGLTYIIINEITFKAGVSYILSGAPNDGSAETRISLFRTDGSEPPEYKDTGFGAEIKFSKDTTYSIRVRFCSAGATITEPITFYPMLRYAEITDDTYEPYVPSVEEKLAELEARLAALEGGE